jgi:hypothetical protein
MIVKTSNKASLIKVKMIRVKSSGKEKWEILFPLDSVFLSGSITEMREKILSIINDAVESITNQISKKHPSRSKASKLFLAGRIISNARQKILKDYRIEISNFLDIFAKLLQIERRNVNFILQLYSSLGEEDIDDSIPWTVYRYCVSTRDKKKSREVLNLYKEGKLKSSNDVRRYVKMLNDEHSL